VRETLGRVLAAARRSPAMVGSLAIILALVGISIYAIVAIPLSEAIALWDRTNEVWVDTPRSALPAWTNLFRREKLPETRIVRTDDVRSTTETLTEAMWRETAIVTFDYPFSVFPAEVAFHFGVDYDRLEPLVTLTWIKPDGTETKFFRGNPRQSARFWMSREIGLEEALGAPPPDGAGGDRPQPDVMNGEYAIRIEALYFEEGFAMAGRVVVDGYVYGFAGTDGDGRDLMIGLLWGTPIALVFGLLATLGTTVFGFLFAAIGAWHGGWVDAAVHRMTEVSMMIPMLPLLIMVAKFYSSSLWVMLGIIIALGILTGAVKSYRAMFLQVKNAPYIEAARAYGAGNARIIFRYLIPKLLPALVPNLVLGIPRFVFLEASLAVLGIGDPVLPTWGKILSSGRAALYLGHYHCVLEPAILLIVTGLAFTMLGYVLDRVFNTQLREI